MKQRVRSTFIAACYFSVSAEGKGTRTPKQDEIFGSISNGQRTRRQKAQEDGGYGREDFQGGDLGRLAGCRFDHRVQPAG